MWFKYDYDNFFCCGFLLTDLVYYKHFIQLDINFVNIENFIPHDSRIFALFWHMQHSLISLIFYCFLFWLVVGLRGNTGQILPRSFWGSNDSKYEKCILLVCHDIYRFVIAFSSEYGGSKLLRKSGTPLRNYMESRNNNPESLYLESLINMGIR